MASASARTTKRTSIGSCSDEATRKPLAYMLALIALVSLLLLAVDWVFAGYGRWSVLAHVLGLITALLIFGKLFALYERLKYTAEGESDPPQGGLAQCQLELGGKLPVSLPVSPNKVRHARCRNAAPTPDFPR